MRMQFLLSGVFICGFLLKSIAQFIPQHDHVVIVMLENKDYGDIIGDQDAPYINSLLNDPKCALLEKYYALTHPSQPNYIMMFSGDDQNIILDFEPFSYLLPYTTPNLGASLIDSGYSFIGYSEDLPSVGYIGTDQGAWVRKHCPWVNWQDATKNGIPSSCNLPFSSFPTNYDSLPTICFVVPNLDNDMHDGSVSQGDAWVKANLDSYGQWAKSNNSLLVITFDETESYISNNKVPAIFIGQNVLGGKYSNTKYDHYDFLRTFQDMYGLPYAGESANGKPIIEIWETQITAIDNSSGSELTIDLYPNPVVDNAIITVKGIENETSSVEIKLYDLQGKEVNVASEIKAKDKNTIEIFLSLSRLSKGTYLYELTYKGELISKDKLIVQ